MNKKVVIGSLLVLVITIVLIIILSTTKETEIVPYYSDDPTTWIDDKEKGIKEVNVDKVSEGNAFIDSVGQQYRDEEIITVFDLEGFYRGEYFKDEYINENGKKIMKINNDMDPKDGIIEGYIIEKIEDDKINAYIFLDDDWRTEIGNTNIFWGVKYEYEKKYDFNEISEGIYMDVIQDDENRFLDDYTIHLSGIIVGDITKNNTEDKTLIRII